MRRVAGEQRRDDPTADIILVVDDDASTRGALSELPKLGGYSVAFADNGPVALNEIQTWPAPAALILLHLSMPVKHGHTFLRRARENHRLKDVAVVLTRADPSATCWLGLAADDGWSVTTRTATCRLTARWAKHPTHS